MPTWNPALWNPANDDGGWADTPLLGGAVGYLYYRTLNGNKLLQLWGEVIPPVPLGQNDLAHVAQLPLGGAFRRWRTCWGTAISAGLGTGPACLFLEPDGAVWLLGISPYQTTQAHVEVTCSIDL